MLSLGIRKSCQGEDVLTMELCTLSTLIRTVHIPYVAATWVQTTLGPAWGRHETKAHWVVCNLPLSTSKGSSNISYRSEDRGTRYLPDTQKSVDCTSWNSNGILWDA